jgi:hypothetical protein
VNCHIKLPVRPHLVTHSLFSLLTALAPRAPRPMILTTGPPTGSPASCGNRTGHGRHGRFRDMGMGVMGVSEPTHAAAF